jgi:hypothetical protein
MQNSGGSVIANIGTVGTLSTAANQSSQITQETATAAALGTTSDTAWVSGSGTAVAILKNIAGGIAGNIPGVTGPLAGSSSGLATFSLITGAQYLSAPPTLTNAQQASLLLQPRQGLTVATGLDAFTVQPGNTANTTPWLTTDSATSATGSAAPAKAAYVGVLDAVGGNLTGLTGDPCQTSTKTTLPITLATAAVKVIATGVSAKKIYVCAIDLTNNAADSVAIFEATTGTVCATSPIAVAGAGTSVATAATGYNFSANGGISKGNGGFQVAQTTIANNDLCVAQSAATQLTGNITYVTR